jgi:hypothetical protein
MRVSWLTLFVVLLASAATLDRVAVVVGKDVLTEGEVEEEARLEGFTASAPPDLSPARRREAADRLVDQQLIRHEMEISHYEPPRPEEAGEMLSNFRRQHFQSDAEFRAALENFGLSEEQLKQYFRWQLATLRFTDARFRPGDPEPARQSADRTAPESPLAAAKNNGPPGQQSADRAASSTSASGNGDVDALLDAWLKQARSATRIEFKKEAFQ